MTVMLFRRCLYLAREVRVLREHNTRLWALNAEQLAGNATLAKHATELQADFDLLALYVPQTERRNAIAMVRQRRELQRLEEVQR